MEAVHARIDYVNERVVACNRNYEGHFLWGLVRLAPQPEVQLLLPMVVHRVSCFLIHCLSRSHVKVINHRVIPIRRFC